MTVTLSELADPASPPAAELEALFNAMYAHFAETAGRPFLRDGGFENWIGNYAKLAGRSRTICLAHDGGKLVGFGEGLLRTPPAYYRPELVGFVAHLYVHPEWQRKGIARDIFGWVKDWFAQKNATAVELQVVQGNESAMRFWQSLGFRNDNVQMRIKLV